MLMDGDYTLDGEHTVQHTDDVLQNCTLETYIILLTNVTPKQRKRKDKKEKMEKKRIRK